MRPAVNTNGLRRLTLADALDRIRRIGADAVEISTDGRAHAYRYFDRPESIDVDLDGLEVAALSGGWCDFASGNVRHLPSQVQLCRWVGTRKLRLFATEPLGGADVDDVRQRVIDQVEAQARRWPDIQLLIENHSGLTATAASVRQIVEAVGRANVGAVYDPINFLRCGQDPIRSLHEMAPCIRHVHAANWGDGEFCALPDGKLDWKGIVRELAAVGYDGFVTIEYFGDREPTDIYRRSLAFLEEILPARTTHVA